MSKRATKYFASIKKAQGVPIDVLAHGDGRFDVELNGQTHEVESLMLPHGAVSMLVDGMSYSVEFEERGDELLVLLNGQLTRVDIADERKLRLRAATKGFTAEGRQVIDAPMPGKVVKVLVKVGDSVAEGQGLVVVEAMKMENELKSPKAGKVLEVTATEGVAVENGAKLVVIE